MWFSLFLIIGAIVAYASERLPMELTSLILIAAALSFFHFFPLLDEYGIDRLPKEKLLMGFSNPALISVMALLVLGQAIIQTGALNEVASFILRISRNSAFFAISISLIVVMFVSAFLNNTPVVVIFIPIMAALAKGVGMSVSRVMIPLSFASILGGMMTLIGSSTNLLVSGIMTEMGLKPLGFFDFTIPGMLMAVAGLIYVMFIVPRILPDRASMVRSFAGDDDHRQFIAQIEIDYSSDFVGQKPEGSSFKNFPDVTIRMVQRGEHAFLPPFDEDFIIRPRDVVVMGAGKKELGNFFAKNTESLEKHFAGFGERAGEEDASDIDADMSMAEIVVAPSSRIVGQTLEQIGFYRRYRCVVLGIERQSRTIRSRLSEIRLAPGDVLLVMGAREDILGLHESRDWLLMEWSTEDMHSGTKAGRTGLIFASVVGLAAFDIMPIAISAFAGVAAILLAGCLNMRQAARALDMKIVLMIGASLALGTALQETGGALYIAQLLIGMMEGASPIAVMSALFFLMMMLTNVLSNNAAAVLFTPIAVNIATQMNVDARMFIFAVIFACNCSFITPIGYQTNLMVMGPGHYKFSDFIRSGVPLAIIIWLVYILFASMFFI